MEISIVNKTCLGKDWYFFHVWSQFIFRHISEIILVSMKKPWPRLDMYVYQWWNQDFYFLSLNNKTETENIWVSMTRPSLKISESLWRNHDQDWKCKYINDETKTFTFWVWITRLRLKISESQWPDQDWKYLSLYDKTKTNMPLSLNIRIETEFLFSEGYRRYLTLGLTSSVRMCVRVFLFLFLSKRPSL